MDRSLCVLSRKRGLGKRPHPVAVLVLVFAAPVLAGGECAPADPTTPRTLVLALDGVPFRVVEEARRRGAFKGWSETKPMISTFPSMTNVAFTAILSPLGAKPVPGYEVKHFDPEHNRIVKSGGFDWKNLFQFIARNKYDKSRIYMRPRSKAMNDMKKISELVLESPSELTLAHVAATDSLTHFAGDEAITELLLRIAEKVEELRQAHMERYGRPLRLVMLSDHGNTTGSKVRMPRGIGDRLREAGLRPSKRLEGPDDVVCVTYGVVGYGVMFLEPERAEVAARALLDHPGVNLAAWISGDRELSVVSSDGEAAIHWRDGSGGRRLAYLPRGGDPLGLSAVQAGLASVGRTDADGFASEADWFEWTALGEFPDAAGRLVRSMDGTWVTHTATVIVSFAPGYAWGARSAQTGAWLRGGKLEATHGGLDRGSTWGFYLRSDGPAPRGPAVSADRVLADLAPCLDLSGLHSGCAHSALHRARVVLP